ncbi:hypothetical protein Vadar_031784 [Vaccinium darrowii]|uniref:Uncharacterized protein n=1 Tax=Vaccinium darrowii TaxID=229202 RepID=A0ACB7YS87_9ERIC|nr:hypothetical protein Vadar_031784 [Vaccinium darrowii]
MMDVDEKLVRVDGLKGVEGKETVNGEVGLERELEGYRTKCEELEERSKKDEERCIMLKMEIEKRMSEFELLRRKFHEFKVEKVGIEEEVEVLKRRNGELVERLNQFEDVNSGVGEEVIELKIENQVLECEKKSAESEAQVWKSKFRELESRVLELEKENLVLRSGQSQLAGMMKSEPEKHGKQTTKPSNAKDEISSEYLDIEGQTVKSSLGDLHAAGTPLLDLSSKQSKQANGRKRCLVSETEKNHRSRVRKQLEFNEGGSLSMKMAPSTPGVARPPSFGIIDISDSEEDVANISCDIPGDVNRMAHSSSDFSPGKTTGDGNKKTSDGNFKRTLSYQSDDEDMKDYKGSSPFISTPKRKRASNIVTTDSERDSDDNIPICKLKTKHLRESDHDSVDSYLNTSPVNAALSEEKVRESPTRRRRLVALRECNVKNEPEQKPHSNSNKGGADYHPSIPTNGDRESDEVEEDESESDTEGENLGGFIVNSSDVSESDDGSDESEDLSDDNVDFNEVLSNIRRSRGVKVKWDFEADMLAAFGKDLELCMKAVCALYRKQTADEKIGKFTYYHNQEGFSQCDALRGSMLAEFLIDGDPQGDVNKSVEELQEYDPKAPELCRTLATHYSKQLFAIYKSKEDPLFLPP